MSSMNVNTSVGILLISDLHFADSIYGRGAGVSRFNESYSFYNIFEMAISNSVEANNIDLKYMIIAGDIADFSLGSEYEKALEILERLLNRFSIDKKNVLIIPGNHDIDREGFRRFCYEKKIPLEQFEKHQSEKFVTFKSFYDEFYSDSNDVFCPDKAITRSLQISECGVLFAGINTLYKDSFHREHHHGFINARALDTELRQLRREHNDDKIIAVMHHTPETSAPSLINTVKNWGEVSPIFQRDCVNVFIAGHAHTNDGITAITKETKQYLTCGSLSASDRSIRSSFMLLKHEKKDMNEMFKILPFNYEEDYQGIGYWQPQTHQPNMIDHITIS